MVSVCRVERSGLAGAVSVPPNKSYTHRGVFLASMADGVSTINNALISDDIWSSIGAARVFGAGVTINGSTVVVEGTSERKMRMVPKVEAGNSGTTARISAAIAGLYDEMVVVDGDSSLQSRPMGPIERPMRELGVSCKTTDGRLPMRIEGPAVGGSITIDGTVSSQFLSGFLIAGPRMRNGLTANVEGEQVSKTYLDATIASMKRFGVDVLAMEPYRRYRVENSNYKRTVFNVPPDHSSMAMLIAAGILVGEGGIEIFSPVDGMPQSDTVFIDVVRRLGGDVRMNGHMIRAKAGSIGGGKVDLSDAPDLLPPMAILGLKSREGILIEGVEHARHKETDRIAMLCRELPKLGATVKENRDGLWIRTEGKLHGAILDPRTRPKMGGDHRLFMVYTMAGMLVGDTSVMDPDCAAVSYPKFLRDMRGLGAILRIENS
ncbi:MAG: 3-phosphoshikimate 1-carboxyvinyltransferase [Candidatus Micrarchaeota archaeon]|nr:3-phosphoshikimate 1-carboxyvinyltransferase [Candidatus Micrarchaeota archaeon]